jgi:hypothetical protein
MHAAAPAHERRPRDAPVGPCSEVPPAPVLRSLGLAVGEMSSSSAAATHAKLLHSGNQPFGMGWTGITRDNLLAGLSKPWEGFLIGIGAGTREFKASDNSTRPFPEPPVSPNKTAAYLHKNETSAAAEVTPSAKDLRPELHEALHPHSGRRSGRLSVRLSAVSMADRMSAYLEGGGLSCDGNGRVSTDTSPMRRPKVCRMPAMRSNACFDVESFEAHMSMFALLTRFSEGDCGAEKSPAVANPSVASCPYAGAPASTGPSVIACAQICPPQRLAVHYLMNDARMEHARFMFPSP